MSTDASFAAFVRILDRTGARDALAYLLGLSEYRFIGIFRFDAGMATAVIHYDRQNPEVMTVAEVPDSATYCCYVRDSRGMFVTANAMSDPRLSGHPAREVVLSYCGIPIMEPDGTLLGTLCHYDLVARDPAQLDLPLLLQVAVRLAQGAHVPAYPVANRS